MTDPPKVYSFYKYNPLPSEKSIRLLELYPSGQGNPEDVNCTLRETELLESSNSSSSRPRYEAISYTWGDPTDKVDILCDGGIIQVTRNLRDALLRFRPGSGRESRIVWADAVCINQDDDVEKGVQVALMKRIYAGASRVCVWLGCASVQMEPAFELMREMVGNVRSTNTHVPEPSETTSERWSALGMFFSAAWFGRLWVVQEVYGHACTVFCGEHEIPWTDVVQISKILLKSDHPSSANVPLWNAISVLQIDSAGDETSRYDIFDSFRYFNCSDRRDKVYALLSFPPLCGLEPPIRPDYGKPVAEVFEEAAVRTFTSCQSLGLLSGIEHDGEIDEDWPSWVPRWDRPRTIQLLHDYASGRAHSSIPYIKHQPGILIAEGTRISTISWCGIVIKPTLTNVPTPTGDDPEPEIDDPLQKPLQEWASAHLPTISQPTNHLLNVLAMTLTVGLDSDSNSPPLDPAKFESDSTSYLTRILPSIGTSHPSNSNSNSNSHILPPALSSKSNPHAFHAAAVRGSKNKRLFSTPSDGYGIGPRAAEAGDHVVLLYGGNAPCVLRAVGGSGYRFVGECYLHGQMCGEVMGVGVVEEFVLK